MLSQINCNNKDILTNGKNFKQICKKKVFFILIANYKEYKIDTSD